MSPTITLNIDGRDVLFGVDSLVEDLKRDPTAAARALELLSDGTLERLRVDLATAERKEGELELRCAGLDYQLERWIAAATTQASKCGTCAGTGIMEVIAGVLPPDGREEYEAEPCAECDGTGDGRIAEVIGYWKQRALAAEHVAGLNRKGGA